MGGRVGYVETGTRPRGNNGKGYSFGTKRTRAGKERAGEGGRKGNGLGVGEAEFPSSPVSPREAPPPVSEFPTEFP